MDKTLEDKLREYKNSRFSAYAQINGYQWIIELIRDMQQALEQQKEREGKLVEALKECSQDLKDELDATYMIVNRDIHPAMQDRYIRDMGSVYKAEATLKELGIL